MPTGFRELSAVVFRGPKWAFRQLIAAAVEKNKTKQKIQLRDTCSFRPCLSGGLEEEWRSGVVAMAVVAIRRCSAVSLASAAFVVMFSPVAISDHSAFSPRQSALGRHGGQHGRPLLLLRDVGKEYIRLRVRWPPFMRWLYRVAV